MNLSQLCHQQVHCFDNSTSPVSVGHAYLPQLSKGRQSQKNTEEPKDVDKHWTVEHA